MVEGGGGVFDVRPAAVQDVGKAVTALAEQARRIDLRTPLNTLAEAVPGGHAAAAARGCKLAGREGLRGWANRVQRHGENLRGAGEGYQRTDRGAGVPFVIGQIANEASGGPHG